jgi:hypothetical protein
MAADWLRRDWGLWVGSAAGAVAGAIAPPAVIVSVSQELIALFGLLLAGALPTMILTATILRAGAFSPKRVGEYGAALEAQLSFWFALFLWAMAACIAVMMAKALWDPRTPYVLWIPALSMRGVSIPRPEIEWSRVANVALGIAAVQVMIRLVPMLHGLRSLLRLNSLIATEEAAAKAKADTSAGANRVRELEAPPGHGSVVDD